MKKKEMEELFPEGFIFQQDGSPVHRADMCLEYINKKIPQTLFILNAIHIHLT